MPADTGSPVYVSAVLRACELLRAFPPEGEIARVQELAEQTEDKELAEHFAKLAKALADNEDTIVSELIEIQGDPVDIGGYYYPEPEKLTAVMRPSKTLNETLESVTDQPVTS